MLGNVFLFQPYNDVIWLRRSRDVRFVRPFKADFQVHAHVCLSGRTGRASLHALQQSTYSPVYSSTVNWRRSGRTSRASLLPVKRLPVFVEQLLWTVNFLYGKKFIFSRMPVNFLPQENLFSPVWKFISSRKEIYFLPYAHKFSPAKKFISSRMKLEFQPQGNLFSTVWNLSFNRMKLEFQPYETWVPTVWNFISMRFQQYCNTLSAVLARNISHFAR